MAGGDGAGVKAGTFGQAAAHGELLVLAVLGDAVEEAIADAGPGNFSGKVVIDEQQRRKRQACKERPVREARRTTPWYSTAISRWPGASSEPSPAELAGSSPISIDRAAP
jgi:hypothetical protein